MQPFAGNPEGMGPPVLERRPVPRTKLILDPEARQALEVLKDHPVLNGWLLSEWTGRSSKGARSTLEHLWRLGLCDRWTVAEGHPLWTLSPAGCLRVGAWTPPDETWDVLALLKGVALETLRLWAWLNWGFEWRNGRIGEFGVLIGRLFPGQLDWLRDAIEEKEGRWLVLCGDETQARELARVVKRGPEWRVTWDDALWSDPEPWYAPVSGRLVRSKSGGRLPLDPRLRKRYTRGVEPAPAGMARP